MHTYMFSAPSCYQKQSRDVINIVPGKAAKFSVTASGKVLKYQWKKNGKDIPGEISSALSIVKTTVEVDGMYQCVVINKAGRVTSDAAQLTVCKL